jgi:hypothetical protein
VHPVHEPASPPSWRAYVRQWVKGDGVPGGFALLTHAPAEGGDDAGHRMEVVEL